MIIQIISLISFRYDEYQKRFVLQYEVPAQGARSFSDRSCRKNGQRGKLYFQNRSRAAVSFRRDDREACGRAPNGHGGAVRAFGAAAGTYAGGKVRAFAAHF